MSTIRKCLLGITFALVPLVSFAGWQDLLNKLPIPSSSPSSNSATGLSALTDSEMTDGLKQALDKAAEIAVNQLGQDGGFLNNPTVRIPLPDSLSWADKGLRTLGQGHLVDEFEQSMNHAAEKAVPVALDEFRSAIRNMTMADAKAILTGPDDAATQYFRKQSGDSLREQFKPIVTDATAKTGVTSAYKNMMGKADMASSFLNTKSLDVDEYVTDKAMDGLFVVIAAEEKRIREDPIARSTDLLKKVFGSLGQ